VTPHGAQPPGSVDHLYAKSRRFDVVVPPTNTAETDYFDAGCEAATAHRPPTRRQTALLIVGAGPAGTAAAIHARRAGVDCIVIDKAVFPRDKCCGDGLTTLALRELEALGCDPDAVPNWMNVDGAWLRTPAGHEFGIPLPPDGLYAAVAPRIDLDAALVDRARAAGAEIIEGVAVTGVDLHDSHVDVCCDNGTIIEATTVIAADGMWSPIRRALGLTPEGYRGEWHAFRQYARNVTGPAAQQLIVWFEPDLLPGYAWSFPLPGGRANVGFGMLRDDGLTGKLLAAKWRELCGRDHVRAALGPDAEWEGRHTAWPIPARVDEMALSHGRVLFVGDAAAATDVMTGEGIGQALLTGRLAAESVSAGGDIAAAYTRAVGDELFADHRMARRLGRVLASRRGAETALGVVRHSGDWGRRHFARWMFEDEPRAIVLTPRRWHRGFLARPGAYRERVTTSAS